MTTSKGRLANVSCMSRSFDLKRQLPCQISRQKHLQEGPWHEDVLVSQELAPNIQTSLLPVSTCNWITWGGVPTDTLTK